MAGRLTRIRPNRAAIGTFTTWRQASWRVVPVGQAIRIQDDRVRGELNLLGYAQTADGGRFTIVGRLHGSPGGRGPSPGSGRPPLVVIRQFTAADDKGSSYSPGFRVKLAPDSGFAEWTGILDLHPDPQHEIRWLIPQPAMPSSPPKLPGKQHNAPPANPTKFRHYQAFTQQVPSEEPSARLNSRSTCR